MAKPMSDETKKKISEALKKRYGNIGIDISTDTGKEQKNLLIGYKGSVNAIQILKNQLKSLPKRGSKKQKEEIRNQIKAHHENIKKIRERAKQIKSTQKSQDSVSKSTERIKKAESLHKVAQQLLSKAKTKEQRVRIQAKIERIKKIIDTNKSIISQGGNVKRGASNPLGFNDNNFCFHSLTENQTVNFWRPLTLQEQRVDFQFLNDKFNVHEQDMQNELIDAVKQDIGTNSDNFKKIVDKKDISAILAFSFLFLPRIKAIILKYLREALESGKKSASDEMGVQRPSTPILTNDAIVAIADQEASNFINDINSNAKSTAINGILKGAATGALTTAIISQINDDVASEISSVSGTTIGEAVNEGRSVVFDDNSTKIKAFQRSEILDNKTCDTCLSLDGRVVSSDDPMSSLDLVHTNCRGIWVPILQDETIDVSIGIPKSIESSFEKVAGYPSVNSFKPLKSPKNTVSDKAQEEIKRRISMKK